MARTWQEVRADMQPDEERVAAARTRIIAAQRAYRLAEVRRAHAVSQVDLAGAMKVSQTRVSAIERGDIGIAQVDTLERYVTALGGRLRIVADFGDEQLTLA